MSTTVDKRVLDMQFKNSEFERNAKQTLSTIQDLKNSLNFTGVGKGFDEISKSANSVKFDRLISSVESIESKFGVLNTAVRNVFSDMVQKAISTGKQILDAFTIDPVTSGFGEYESKIGSIQTILANTASRQKEVSQDAIKSINDEAAAAVESSKALNEQQIENLQEAQAQQDKALSKQFAAQNKAYEKQAAEQTKQFEKQTQKRIEAFDKQTEKELEAVNKSYEKRYSALESEQNKELTATQSAYEEKLKLLEASQKNETKVLEKAYKEQTKAYEKEVKNQTKAMEDRFDAQTDALQDSIDDQIDILQEQHEEELDALEKANDDALDEIEERYSEQLDIAEKAADEELDALEQKYEEQLDLLEETTDSQMEALEDYYDEAFDALEESQDAENELLKKNHDAKLDMYEEEYMAKLKVADEDRYNKIKAIDDQIDSIKNLEKAEKAERKAAEDRQKLQELQEAVDKAETATERMRAEQKLADFRQKLADEQKEQEREQQIETLESQKAAVNEEYELRKQNIKDEYETQKANENDLYDQEKKNLDSLHEDQKDALKKEQEEQTKALKKQIEDQKKVIKDSYDYQKELLDQQKKDQQESIKEQQKAETEALKEEQEARKKALKDQQELEEEALKKETEAQKKALKDQQELERDALKEQQEAQKEALAETYEIRRQSLEERQKKETENLNIQNAAEKKAIEDTFNERREKLDKQYENEITAINNRRAKEKEKLNERIESEREALNDRIDAGRQALQDSQDAQKTALDQRQKAELKAMKARHAQELANIESEKNARIAALNADAGKTEASSLEDVTDALDELNKYADDTIYNFEDMTRNIGTFTAAGVGLDDSVKAIKGIANLAALSGSNATQASTAMYQLSQAISTGSLKLQDWNSVVNAGMGGALFQESLKETARAHGIEVDKMIAKEGSFRDSLQDGWITSEVLLETLAKFTGDLTEEQLKSMGYTEDQVKDIIDLGNRAVDAATKVRTWSQLIDTTKEALGSGWAETFEIIFGNFDEATNLWSEVGDQIGSIIDKTADARNELLTGWKDSGGREDLIQAVRNVFEGLQSIVQPVKEAFSEIFPPLTVQNLVDFTKKLKDLTARLKISTETSDKLKAGFKSLFSGIKTLGGGFVTVFKAMSPVWDLLKKLGSKVIEFATSIGKLFTNLYKTADEMDLFNKAASGIKDAFSKGWGAITSILGPVIDKIDEFRKSAVTAFEDAVEKAGGIEGVFTLVGEWFDSVKDKAKEAKDYIANWVSTKFANIDTSFIDNFKQKFIDAYNSIKEKYGGISGIIDELVKLVKNLASKAGGYLSDFGGSFGDFVGALGKFSVDQFSNLFQFFEDMVSKAGGAKEAISNFIDMIKEWIGTHFKAPDFSFIFDFLDTLTTRTVTMERSQGAINYKELHQAVFKDADLDAMEDNMTKAVNLLKEKIQWIKDNMTFDDVYEAIKKVTVALIGLSTVGMIRAFKGIGESISGVFDSIKGIFNGVTDILDSVRGVFEEVQKNLQMKKYTAISKIVLTLAISIRILADAIKILSDLKPKQLLPGAIALGALLAEVALITGLLSKFSGDAKVNSLAVLAFAEAMKILSKSIEELGAMDLPSLAKGVVAVMVSLASLGGASWLVSKNGFNASAGVGLLAMASSLLIVQKAVQMFAQLNPSVLKKGGIAAAAALTALSTAATFVGAAGFKTTTGVGMIAFASALLILQKALEKFGNMNMAEIGRGFTGLVAGLVPLTAAVVAAGHGGKVVAGASALTIASVALLAIAKSVQMLGDISLGQVGTDLALFAGMLGSIVIAAAATEPVLPGMLALAAAIGAIGIAAAGIGVGVTLFVAALGVLATTSEAALTAVVAAFGLLASGILQTIKLLAPQVGDVIVTLVNTMCDVLVRTAPNVAEAALNLMVTLLDTLIDHVPEVADRLFNLIEEVLNALTIYVPEIVQTVVTLLTLVFASVIEALKSQDTDTMLDAIIGMILIESMMKKMAALSKIGPQALIGIAEAGVAIVELGAVLAAIGALSQIPGLKWLMGEGIKTLQLVGGAIGKFIGAIIGGILNGISAQLPEIAVNLVSFINNLQPFLDKVQGVKKKHKNGVVQIFEIIALMTGAAIIDSISKFFTLPFSYTRMGSELSAFIIAATPFLNKVKNVKAKSLKGVKSIASIILTLTAANVIDGLTSWFTGGNALTKFGAELETFGPHLKAYADSIAGLDSGAVQASAKAMKILAKAAEVVPNTGGVLSQIIGDNALDDWGAQLEAFGPHLKSYAENTKGIDSDSVKGSASAMKILAKAAKTVPNTGGALSKIIGDNALDDWGAQLEAFGPHLKQYASDTEGISEDSVKGSANAMKILARAAKTIPNSGGIVSVFTGDNTLDSFGAQLEAFGVSLGNYAESIKNVNAKKVTASAKASQMLVNMANNVPTSGGLLQGFFGEKNLETFGGQLLQYGKAIKKYNKQVQGIGTEAIVASASAGASLVALANNLPEDEGFFGKLFGGDKDLGSFGKQLKKFGAAMLEYYNSVSGIKDTSMMISIGSITSRMIDLALRIQDISIKVLGTLGGYIADLGDDMADYYDSINDVDYTQVETSITSIENIVGLAETLKDLNTDAFTNFGNALKSMAEAGIEGFVQAFENAEEDTISSVKGFINSVTKGLTDKSEDVKTGGETVGGQIPDGLISGMGSKGREINDQILLITGAIVTAFSTNLSEDTFKGLGSTATNALSGGFSAPGREVLSSITTLTGGIVKQFQTGLKADIFAQMGRNCNTNIASGLNNTLDRYRLIEAVQGVCSTIKSGFNTNLTYDQMKDIAVVSINGLIYGLSNGTQPLTRTSYDVAKSAKDQFGSTLSYTAGQNSAVNFVNGIIRGIGDGTSYINSAVQTVANNAVNALNNSWQIHSPSRITYESGSFYAEGAAEGIKDGEKDVVNAVEDLGDSAADAFDDVDDNMGVDVTGDLDLSDEAKDVIVGDAEEIGDSVGGMGEVVAGAAEEIGDSIGEASDVVAGEAEEMTGELGDATDSLDKTKDSVNTLGDSLDAVGPDVIAFGSAVNDTTNSVNAFFEAIRTLVTDIQSLIEVVNSLKEAIDTANTSVVTLNTSFETLSTKISALSDKLDPLKTKVDTVTDSFDKMAQSIDTAASSLGKYDNSYTDSKKNTKKVDQTDASFAQKNTTTPSTSSTGYLDYSAYTGGTTPSTNGYLNYSSGSSYSYGDYTNSNALDQIEDTVSTTITDEMRKQKYDLELDISDAISEGVEAAKDDVRIVDDEPLATTSSIKATAAQMAFNTTKDLTSKADKEIKSSNKKAAGKEDLDYSESRIIKAIEANGNANNKQTTVTNNNTFNITSTDPKESASEIGIILQKQVVRSKAVWGS